MKLATWNVNGLRACREKGFDDYFFKNDIDVICLQEVKMNEPVILSDRFKHYYNFAEKKGYSGTAIITNKEPVKVYSGIGDKTFDLEGRTLTADFGNFFLVNCYVPNSKKYLSRLEERMVWEEKILDALKELDSIKPVVYCGDLNVAPNPIDLFEKLRNGGSPGYTVDERQAFRKLCANGFVDVYRKFFPNEEGAYTYWSYLRNCRRNNFGWRLDFFLVSERIFKDVSTCRIRQDIYGSDHCPVEMELYL